MARALMTMKRPQEYPPVCVIAREQYLSDVTIKKTTMSGSDSSSKSPRQCTKGVSSKIIITCHLDIDEGPVPEVSHGQYARGSIAQILSMLLVVLRMWSTEVT